MKFMKKQFLLFIAFVSLVSFRHPQVQSDEWVYEREKKGIKVFTKKSRWGRLRDSKATMIVPISTEKAMHVLTDFDNYKTWFPRCSKSRLVAKLSSNEMIVHLHFNAPWPVKDRDCVMRVRVERDPKSNVITITEISEPKYLREEADVVRIEQLVSVWKLIPENGGTEIINEYATNPGGNIPDWMTNTQSVENPIATFENLKERTSTRK
jgi:ribosome-associated toxin RatA of RatAB toxin-antitoxin module